jgi:hypothetical protein
MEREAYYRHSGAWPPRGAALGLGLGALAAGLSAGLYAYLALFIPLAGVVSFVLAIGFGMLLGLATGVGLRLGHVRHSGVASGVGALVALLGLYLAWALWIAARGTVDASGVELMVSPGVLWTAVAAVGRSGSWSVAGFAPVGPSLVGFWLLEALLVGATAVFLARSAVASPYCEGCQSWTRATPSVATVAATERGLLVERLEAGQIALLEQLGPAAPDATCWLSLDLDSCTGCDDLHALSVNEVTVSIDERGARSEVSVPVLTGLLVTGQAANRIRALHARPAASRAAA